MTSKILLILIGFVYVVIAVVLWVLFWPINVLQTNVQPYEVITPMVEAEKNVTYLVDACKYKSVPSTVTRTFVNEADGSRYPSITSVTNIKTGCRKTKVSVPVPNYIPGGKYHLEIDPVYQANPFRQVSYHLETESFKVASPAGKLK